MLIFDVKEEFAFEQKINGFSKKYIEQTDLRLKKFLEFCEAENLIYAKDIKPIHIKLFIQKLLDEKTRKNRTINNFLSTIKVFTRFIKENEYSDINAAEKVKNLKEERIVITTFSQSEVLKMLKIADSAKTYSAIRDKTIITFLLETGVRATELCNIKNSDISGDRIFIKGKGNIERYVYISKKMFRQMKKYEKAKRQRFREFPIHYLSDHYFVNQEGDQLTRSGLHKITKKIGEKAKVRKDVRCSPHDFRHYYAQRQLINGLDVYTLSRLLGHTSVEITQAYLKGLDIEDVLNKGRKTSPLSNL